MIVMKFDDILDLPIKTIDIEGLVTIRSYLMTLLLTLWGEGEGFSGKRPFGNSGWQYDVYSTLIKHGVIDGKLDDDGFIESFNEESANAFVRNKIISPFFNQ